MDLPGYEDAIALGYSLGYHGGDKQSASYTKDRVVLTIWNKEGSLEARLEYIWKLLVVRTPSFTFPNKNFKIFEDQIFLARDRLGKE